MILNYIIVLIIFSLPVGVIIYMLYKSGYFGLRVEVNVKRNKIYAWYKSEIIESDYFYLTDSINRINFKRDIVKKDAVKKIRKIKELESKL